MHEGAIDIHHIICMCKFQIEYNIDKVVGKCEVQGSLSKESS